MFHFINLSTEMGFVKNKDICFIIYRNFTNNLHLIECLNVRDFIEMSVTFDIKLIYINCVIDTLSELTLIKSTYKFLQF